MQTAFDNCHPENQTDIIQKRSPKRKKKERKRIRREYTMLRLL